MKKLLLVLLVMAAATPSYADLHFTTRFDARPLAAASGSGGSPIGAMLVQMLPSGETHSIISGSSVRTEVRSASGRGAFPAGTVLLLRDASLFVLDPVARTYYSVRPPSLPPGLQPQVTRTRTGEFATVAGVRTERVTTTTRVDLPLPGPPPPGMPTSVALEGEMWVTDAFSAYTAAMTGGLAVLLGPQAPAMNGGFVMRQVQRSPQFGYETEMTVSDIAEQPADPALFAIPADYRQVAPPATPNPR